MDIKSIFDFVKNKRKKIKVLFDSIMIVAIVWVLYLMFGEVALAYISITILGFGFIYIFTGLIYSLNRWDD